MERRRFISLLLPLVSLPVHRLYSAESGRRGPRHTTYPYGRFGGGRGAASDIEKTVDVDDDWAKNDLIAGGSDKIRLREAVSFGAYAAFVEEWRVSESLLTLREQINILAPKRAHGDDGFIGDPAHRTRNSDHNPWVLDNQVGVVTAFDVTHGPSTGCDAGAVAASLAKSRDKRIKYIIWNRRIVNSEPVRGIAAWTWRPYGGANPHDHHAHISVLPEKALFDSKSNWPVSVR